MQFTDLHGAWKKSPNTILALNFFTPLADDEKRGIYVGKKED
jgi:hypothetical protein